MEQTIFGFATHRPKGLILLRRYKRSDGTPKYLPIGDEVEHLPGTDIREKMTSIFQEQTSYYEEHWLEFAIFGNRKQREYFLVADISADFITRLETGPFEIFEYTKLPDELSPSLRWLINYLWIPRFNRAEPLYVSTHWEIRGSQG